MPASGDQQPRTAVIKTRRSAHYYAAAWPASSAVSADLVTERPHNMQSKVCNGARAPKFGTDRANLIEVPQCGQDGEG